MVFGATLGGSESGPGGQALPGSLSQCALCDHLGCQLVLPVKISRQDGPFCVVVRCCLKRIHRQRVAKSVDRPTSGYGRKGTCQSPVYEEIPPRVEYSLIDLGKSLKPILNTRSYMRENYKAKNDGATFFKVAPSVSKSQKAASLPECFALFSSGLFGPPGRETP